MTYRHQESRSQAGHKEEAHDAPTKSSNLKSPVLKPSNTEQTRRDAAEKRRHVRSENALESSQEKNPVPPGSTRRQGAVTGERTRR